MTAHALLFTIASIGIAEVVYLIGTRKAHEHPVCPIGGGCTIVLESKYNRLFGIHNDILGLMFYVSMSILMAFLVLRLEPMAWWEGLVQLLVVGAVLMSLLFLYLQWRVIKAWCFWCIMSAATTFLMGIIILTAKLII